MGYFKTALLMAAMTALFMGLGYLLGGSGGMIIAFVVAATMNVFTWWKSDQMVLRMNNARPLSHGDTSGIRDLVAGLASNAGLPMPAVYLIETDQPNAFATGRNPQNAAVAVTTGLMRTLSREELAGVIAHELAHIKHHDTAIMTVTATFAGAISMLANFALFFGGSRERLGFFGTLAMMILAPMAAALVQMAISRTREYAADKEGAQICGHPLWLASALERIQAGAARIDNAAAERNPATAHMYIINPLHGGKRDNLFATHPATENRVAALRAMAGPDDRAPRSGTRFTAPSATASTGTGAPWGGTSRPAAAPSRGRPAGKPDKPSGPWG